ncbi:MAG: MASE3 domain-containing protein, partial [Planctomycetota bacterium]
LGIAYLFVAALDLLHTLSYEGMGVFSDHSSNLATQLWIAARYAESLSLLLAGLLIGRKLKGKFLLACYTAFFALLLASIFKWNFFPICFIEGSGLTPFKKISEYIIIFLLTASIVILFKRRHRFEKGLLKFLIASIAVTIVSEFAFTLYMDVTGFFNFIGHYLKIISFYLIYRAVVETGLSKPLTLLFRDLKQREHEMDRLARFPSENPNPVLRISKDGTILYANSASNIVLETWHCEVGKQIPEPCRQQAKDVFASGEVFRFEFNCHDGTILLVTLSPVVEEGYLNAYGIDITNREQIEKALEAEKEFTETALDSQTDTFFVFDPLTGKAIRWNKAFKKASGYSDEEIESMKAPECYYAKEDLEKAAVATEKILKEGTATVELSLITKDGRSVPTEYTGSVIRDDKGKPLYVIAMGRDIADRKKMELVLKESEEKFRNLAEQSPNMIFIHQNNRIVYVNKKCEEIMGYTKKTFYALDFDFLSLIAPESRELITNNFNIHMSGQEVPPVEYILVTKEGAEIEAILTTKLMKYGGQTAILGTITDITLLKQAEKAIRKSEKELAIRNRIAEIFLTVPDQHMYSEVLDVILEAMESRHGVFGYIDENEALVCPSMTTDIWDKCKMTDRVNVFPREKWGGIWGKAMIEKKTLFSNESFNVPRGHIPMKRALIVPILYQGQLIGNIMVGNKQTDYKKEDSELLEAIADKIAPILAARLEKDKWEKERKEAQQELKKAHVDLEKRVEERTEELAKSRETLRMLARKLLSVQEEERRRLARELHDDLTQRLAILA